MEQILQILTALTQNNNINLQAFGLAQQTVTVQPAQPVQTLEVVQAKINLVIRLNDIPAVHNIIDIEPHMTTVNELGALTNMEGTIGVPLTTEQLTVIGKKIDDIINDLEAELMTKLTDKLNALGLGALTGLISGLNR